MTEIEAAGDWELVRAKFLFKKLQLPPPDDAGTVTAFRDGEVTLRENRRTEGYTFATKEIGYQGVRPGDLVIHAMDAFAGAIGVSDSFGKCSPVYSVCEPKRELDVRYYAYLLRDFAVSGQIASLTQGIRERSTDFRFNVFGELRLPYFDAAHQRAIASFLDRETSRIDTLIDKKRRLLDLLEEKRTALITRAVTRGLDPHVPMTDSGVEWIGEIPEHWEVIRMRYLCRLTTGGRDTQDAEPDGEYPFVVRSNTLERISTYSFEGEGVLTSGDGAGVGEVFHHMTGKFDFHQRVYLFHGFRRLKGRFLYHFLRENLYKVVLAVSAKSTVDSLRRPMLLDFPVTVPPAAEQQRIVGAVDESERELDRIKGKVHSAIMLLQEYRTALISAAVTGKIDVRDKVPA